jgi:hypothetical protein
MKISLSCIFCGAKHTTSAVAEAGWRVRYGSMDIRNGVPAKIEEMVISDPASPESGQALLDAIDGYLAKYAKAGSPYDRSSVNKCPPPEQE